MKQDDESKKDVKGGTPAYKSSGSAFKAWGTGVKTIAEHTVVGGDTLSHIALKYYGHATKPYWTVIYEANKAVIGDDPNKVKRGITLKIPELPKDLK